MTKVESFLAYKLVKACPMIMAPFASKRPLQVPVDLIPPESILGHPLGSNIQDILEDFDLELDNSVGMEDENVGGPTTEVESVRPQPHPLSPVREVGTTS